MIKIKNTLMTVALATGLSVIPLAAQSGGRHGGPRGNFGDFMGRRGAVALDLTEAQKQFAKDLRTQNRERVQAIHQQLQQNRQAMQEAVKANNLSQIQVLANEQGRLHGQMSAIHAESMAKFWAQLTPEQKQKAEEARSKMRERMKNRRGGGAGQGQQGPNQAN
jgi:Spy/CpxP family protein refolding chaperone